MTRVRGERDCSVGAAPGIAPKLVNMLGNPTMVSAAETNPVPAPAAVEESGASPLLLTTARVAPFAIWAAVILGALLSRPPTAPIELETLSTAWHMLQSGSWIPLLNGEITPRTPPLHAWLILAGWKVFGVVEIWPRLLGALAAL